MSGLETGELMVCAAHAEPQSGDGDLVQAPWRKALLSVRDSSSIVPIRQDQLAEQLSALDVLPLWKAGLRTGPSINYEFHIATSSMNTTIKFRNESEQSMQKLASSAHSVASFIAHQTGDSKLRKAVEQWGRKF